MLEQAMSLLNEHRREYVFYTPEQKYAFHRRLRRLAIKIDCNEPANVQAVLTIDVIATRCDIQVKFSNE